MEQLLYWLTGVLGVPLINSLKQTLGLSGKSAMWLTAGVAGILALLAIGIDQQISFSTLAPETLMAVFAQVLSATTLAYKLLRKES